MAALLSPGMPPQAVPATVPAIGELVVELKALGVQMVPVEAASGYWRLRERRSRLAREGLSNPEVSARLFITPNTVRYHLGEVFTKPGITMRGQQRVFPFP
jgi:hypothetical protein